MQLLDLFPKTIAVGDLQTLSTEIITEATGLIDLDRDNAASGQQIYTADQQLLENSIFNEVKQEILALCREFSKAYSHIVADIVICNSWGNRMKFGDAIRNHRHSNAYICGTFYLSDGSPFNITDRGRTELFGFSPALEKNDNYRAYESFTINPKPGRIILFPAGMTHCALPSNSQKRRYSVAFNAVPVGRFGGPTGMLELRLSD